MSAHTVDAIGRLYQRFICMGCGYLFRFAFESRQVHVCTDCYPLPDQWWGIKGYPGHRQKEDFDAEVAEEQRVQKVLRETRAAAEALKQRKAEEKEAKRLAKWKPGQPCTFKGCPRVGREKGYCRTHHYYLRRKKLNTSVHKRRFRKFFPKNG